MTDKTYPPPRESCQVKRPLLRYHGGKWLLAPKLIATFPQHRKYLEPFGGGGSVLLRKSRAYAETYNDLDEEVVGLFRVVRDRGEELARALEFTPFSRADFLEAWHPSDDPLEQARRTVIRSFMGFGSAAATMSRSINNPRTKLASTGFRANSDQSGTTPARDWANYPECLRLVVERLRGVVIENRPAAQIIEKMDGPDTLIYADPPYMAETRDKGGDYRHEMTEADHAALLEQLCGCKSMVVLSGYSTPMYEELLRGWNRHEIAALADGARPRTEVVWSKGFEARPVLL